MSAELPDLRSVNWTTGMLLTPEHFRLQDGASEAAFHWLLRYAVADSGLIGGGVRAISAGDGMERYDPVFHVVDEDDAVQISVSQARGITPDGRPIDIREERPVRGTFQKAALGSGSDFLVYVVSTGARQPDEASVGADPDNPTHPVMVAPEYEVRLAIPAEQAPKAIVVGRIRRVSETLEFEVDGEFIPKCATVSGHSSLSVGCARIRQKVVSLAGRYAEVHRAVSRYITQVSPRGIDTGADREIQAFIERAALALDGCAYELMDSADSPDRFFQQIDRAGRRAALGLDLSPATQLFFGSLTGADAGYGQLLEEERSSLEGRREVKPRDDLRLHLDAASATLARLGRLIEALEGKYIDYRVNKSLSSLRFLLDRGGEHFYQAVSTSSHAQRDGSLLTFVFSDLNLQGRKEYRIVLVGDPDEAPTWQIGDRIACTARINAAAGRTKPRSESLICEVPGQRNFGMNFVTPNEVDTINGLHLAVEPAQTIRTAILFQRRLGLATDNQGPKATWTEPKAKREEAAAPSKPPQPKIKIRTKRPEA